MQKKYLFNYLHYGNSISCLSSRVLSSSLLKYDRLLAKKVLLRELNLADDSTQFGAEVIRSYGSRRKKNIDLDQLYGDLRQTEKLRETFHRLACRGFSFRIADEIRFPDVLREDINLRVGILPDKSLFYPLNVWRRLSRVGNNHYFEAGSPSVAFALGMRRASEHFIFVLQSDLAFHGSSCVREHFRGWRKVLFASVLYLCPEEVRTVYLCHPDDALRACHPSFKKPTSVPEVWKSIYDRTASFFGMHMVHLEEEINIQIFPDLKPVRTNRFYKLAVTPQLSKWVRQSFLEA